MLNRQLKEGAKSLNWPALDECQTPGPESLDREHVPKGQPGLGHEQEGPTKTMINHSIDRVSGPSREFAYRFGGRCFAILFCNWMFISVECIKPCQVVTAV
jgi:hypothetical protein